MLCIYKYDLSAAAQGSSLIEIVAPQGARPVFVGVDPNERASTESLRVWMEADTAKPLAIFRFMVLGTGQPMRLTEPRKYLNSVICPPFIWHVYQLPTWNKNTDETSTNKERLPAPVSSK